MQVASARNGAGGNDHAVADMATTTFARSIGRAKVVAGIDIQHIEKANIRRMRTPDRRAADHRHCARNRNQERQPATRHRRSRPGSGTAARCGESLDEQRRTPHRPSPDRMERLTDGVPAAMTRQLRAGVDADTGAGWLGAVPAGTPLHPGATDRFLVRF